MNAKDQILNFLKRGPGKFYSPTEIGMACGKTYAQGSSWANAPLKRLIAEGQVVKQDRKYKLKVDE